ncbi:MAG: hypothetical protein HY711_09680, partial [Candidatus Melainabacteria bacterium]|nr:hypothetical protein [Candidatus Melainabacteria bacterium]
SNGTPIKFIEPTGTTWLKQNDSAKWTSNKGTTWYGQVEVNKDGDYSFAGRDDHKLHIIGSNGCERILRPSQDFGQIVQQHFTQLDTDGDGWLSKREINAAMQNPTIKGELAQAVSALKEHQNELMKLSNDEWFFENDGVTATDIIEFDRLQKNVTQQQSSESVTSKLVNGIDWTMGYARDVLKQTSRALYNDKVNPVASIASKAVRQGFVGDCAYMGTLSAVAAFNPQSIVKMIEEKGKEFKVTFPGAKDKPVTVSAPTEPELARYASGHKYGLWVPVVEKALGEFERKRSVGWSVPDLAHEAIDDGQYLDYTLQLLTGKKIEITGITLGVEDTIHAKLKEACLAKYPVVADIEPGTPNCRGLVGNHTYTILSYDAQKHIVTVRNPWGFGEIKRPDGGARDGTDDGVFRMSLVEFCSSFKSICVATE